MAFSPVNASKDISQKYTRYLSTIFSLADPEYQRLFEQQLKQTPFAKGPFLEVTDAFEKGPTILELMERGELPPTFDLLGFHNSRPLYRHQADALRKISGGANAVVSTGTGSGKTESFLLPILRDLVAQSVAGQLGAGVRAMLIYPMNALANDQMERLRELLRDYPSITFGSYTGQTEEEYTKALTGYRSLNEGRDPIPNELICRQQMKAAPPHILITNYAMLEYLMVRPDDDVFFQPHHTKNWKYIVLDEAHVYKGSTGIEVSMLLRRLKARLGKKDLQYILTSATLGSEDDNASVADFARNLCASAFRAEDIIRAKRVLLRRPANCQNVSPVFYHTLAAMIMEDASEEQLLRVIRAAYPDCPDDHMEALYEIACADPFYWKVRELLQKPRTIMELLRELDCSEERLTDFVTVVTRAVRNGAKLFDARYHMFLRAAESVFITLQPRKQLFLESRKTYTENDRTYKVFEIASCNHCHALYILGKESAQHILEQTSFAADEEPRAAYLIAKSAYDSDDEHTMEHAGQSVEAYELCPVCGALSRPGGKRFCDHGPTVTVQKVSLQEGNNTLSKCPACENTSATGVLRQFFVGQEAVTSVVGTALFENLPSYNISYRKPELHEDEWGFDDDPEVEEVLREDVGAKQFIAFSDSRQAAAFYATYLDQTYRNIAYKRLIVQTLKHRGYEIHGKNLDAFVEDLTAQFERYGMAQEQSAGKEAWKAALHEAVDNNGVTSLYNLGLIRFDIVGEHIKGNSKFRISRDEMQELCALFADWIMSEGSICYPEFMNRDDKTFFAHNGIEHRYTLSDADEKTYTLSFLPSRSDRNNKRVSYLEKVLKKKGLDIPREHILKLLEGMWQRFFTADKAGLMTAVNGAYMLRSDRILVSRPRKLYICKKCRRITPHNIERVCPAYRCDGELEPFAPAEAFADNHYYHIYQDSQIRPLRVVEHTAQLDKETAYDYQQKFKRKELDILSCSTTFEMGVDVGSLETVFMRNVPPSPANYAQRAGRAGRSMYSAAFALTFCNKSNHDFSFFRDPTRMIKGRIEPPVFNTENSKIAVRHIYATAFSFFWKKYPQMFSTAAEFMENGGIELLADYLHEKPEELKQYLIAFLPAGLISRFDVEHYGWVDGLLSDEGALTIAYEDYMEIVDRLREAANQAFASEKTGVDAYNQRLHVFQRERILTYLARKNIFPKYGFPVDTVEMTLLDHTNPRKSGLQLQRDLSSAISEYAPGAQIVANGKLITSRYIRKRPDRSWKMSRYHICSQCGDLNLSFYEENGDAPLRSVCGKCGAQLEHSKAGVYLIPEFGFEADGSSIRKPGLKKPIRTFRSEVSYIGGSEEEAEQVHPMGNAFVHIRCGKSEELAVLNRSRFFVCTSCGYTELDEKRFTPIMLKKHRRSTGTACPNNRLQNFSLAYRFETDVLTLCFTGMEVTEQDQALSLLYGILEGTSKALEVERSDIAGCLQWFWNEESRRGNYGFVLYDKTPGGAGHVRRLADPAILKQVLIATVKLIRNCSCGGTERDTSCYSCLRNYYNQKHHELLQRRYVINFLSEVLE